MSPGSPMESHLLSLVTSQDPNQRMPPEGDPLTGSQIQVLSDWIKDGAVMPEELSGESALTTDHWSFQKLQAPRVPRDHAADVANDIDRFISARLKALSLRLSNRAENGRLIRRLFLVMHGLPPTPRQSSVWLKRLRDDHDKWWPKLVEEVLASPRYGERWARHWLDIVRFGETHGFETNRERPNAWSRGSCGSPFSHHRLHNALLAPSCHRCTTTRCRSRRQAGRWRTRGSNRRDPGN